MKKSIQLFALMICIFVWQGCGSKTKEKETNTDNIAKEVSDKNAKAEEAAAKRARIEKARAEKAEARRLAAIEKAKKTPTYKDKSGKVVYNKVEVAPSYAGGDKAMSKYLKDNLKYPQDAVDKGVEGTVFIEFVVAKNGKVREVVVADAVGEDVDQSLKDEAARVVAAMPAWVPGRQHGKAVDANFSIPITFELATN